MLKVVNLGSMSEASEITEAIRTEERYNAGS